MLPRLQGRPGGRVLEHRDGPSPGPRQGVPQRGGRGHRVPKHCGALPGGRQRPGLRGAEPPRLNGTVDVIVYGWRWRRKRGRSGCPLGVGSAALPGHAQGRDDHRGGCAVDSSVCGPQLRGGPRRVCALGHGGRIFAARGRRQGGCNVRPVPERGRSGGRELIRGSSRPRREGDIPRRTGGRTGRIWVTLQPPRLALCPPHCVLL